MKEDDMITGANIAGGNGQFDRVEDDYYATPPDAVRKLLREHWFTGHEILEPCVGGGHIADVLKYHFRDANFTFLDLYDRGYPGTIQADFLQWEPEKKYDTIITNPPYILASEFIKKCYDLLTPGGQLAMFLKIQFLEGMSRQDLFYKYPPKYVYVFRKRISAWNNGMEKNPQTGKKWASTITFCWYIWQKEKNTEPVIRWIE